MTRYGIFGMNEHANGHALVPSARHRVLFVPGLFRRRFLQSGRLVADLLAKQLESSVVSVEPDLLLDDGGRCNRYLVNPASGSCNRRPVEIVEVAYDDVIREHDRGRALFRRAFLGIRVVVTHLPRIVRLFGKHELAGSELPRLRWRQIRWVLKYALSYVAFTGISLFLLVQILIGTWGQVSPAVIRWLAGFLGGVSPGTEVVPDGGVGLAGWVASAAVMMALAKTFVSKELREMIEDDASSAFAFVSCQERSELRHALVTRVQAAIVASERMDGNMDTSVMAYSQGALLAIYALFQEVNGTTAPSGAERDFSLLLTFGCPLEIATRLWPRRVDR